MAESTSVIKIAVIGGGLAGATIANALLRHAHLEVHVYESAPEFSERGAAIGLPGGAQRALQQVVGVSEATAMLQRAGAVLQASTRTCIGSGTHAGAIILDLGSSPETGTRVVHRASLLRELLAPLPAERLHASKALSEITATATGDVQVTFSDGQNDTFHAVIGADGIFGAVRRYVLQETADDDAPSPAGFWDCRNVVPFEKAKETLGAQYFETDRQYGWAGNGAFIMHDVLDNRTNIQCVISAIEKDPPKDRKRPLTREFLEETLHDWLHGPIGKGMIDNLANQLILDQPEPQAYSQWEHKSTRTFSNGRVCIVGDAAHASTPWQGAGTGQAFEDAMILGTLLGETKVPSEITRAFQAYNAVRRDRCQRVIDSSRGTGLIFCGQDPDAGLDPEKIRGLLAPRWDFIASIDLAAYKEEALEKMKAL
ncbi:Salicylate hydroxylase [Cytospora mali]|uniref:Salicylate hydroxylase n=1 Tax=Cytospora mali TaxID=578113 RepID=A0A194VSK0_CYTMA|nr:Salicylate hydroxylase [Valsa mali]